MKQRAPRLFLACYLTLLMVFSIGYLLDTFVRSERYQNVSENQIQMEQEKRQELEDQILCEEEVQPTEEVISQAMQVLVWEENWKDTVIHIAEITLQDITQLKTAFAQDTYGRNVTETVSSMAERKNAILAINGDYYGSSKTGYVFRNGELYRSTAQRQQQDLCIMMDGSMSLIWENEVQAEELAGMGVWQLLSFGPGLVDNGQVIVNPNTEVGQARASNPRTAIAMLEPLHYLFVVADGRTQESAGLTLYELAEWLKEKKAVLAYNLDGGGSSTMVYDHEVINFPTTNGRYKERAVSDIVYIIEE